MLLQGTPCPPAFLSPGQPRARSSAGLQNTSRCRQTAAEHKSRGLQRHTAVAEEDRQTEELQVEGIDNKYCDEFVCTSSPQVEQNIKALARDLLRLTTYTGSLYTKGVRYKVSKGPGSKGKKKERLYKAPDEHPCAGPLPVI